MKKTKNNTASQSSHSVLVNRITSELEWNDLPLSKKSKEEIKALKARASKSAKSSNRSKSNYVALFNGPQRSGKTLAACLLGKSGKKDVYRIDLSSISSKYIGETEKNLSTLFEKAEKKDWILFFDEADALFGKRSKVEDAHDKYANQEVSYLLQRIEDYNGIIILSCNFEKRLSPTFKKRFKKVVQFGDL